MTKLCFATTGAWDKANVFGCAGLDGLLEQPLDTMSSCTLLFGEVCTLRESKTAYGNRMISKLTIRAR